MTVKLFMIIFRAKIKMIGIDCIWQSENYLGHVTPFATLLKTTPIPDLKIIIFNFSTCIKFVSNIK